MSEANRYTALGLAALLCALIAAPAAAQEQDPVRSLMIQQDEEWQHYQSVTRQAELDQPNFDVWDIKSDEALRRPALSGNMTESAPAAPLLRPACPAASQSLIARPDAATCRR